MKALFIIFTVFLTCGPALAEITCSTPRGAKVFNINESSVTVQHPFKAAQQRAVASALQTRTKYQGKGFTKVLYHQGNKHILHVDNTKSFSELDDYVVIRSKEGHEMTYPLSCQNS